MLRDYKKMKIKITSVSSLAQRIECVEQSGVRSNGKGSSLMMLVGARKRGSRRRKVGVRLNKHCVHDFDISSLYYILAAQFYLLSYLRMIQIASQAPIATSFHHLYKLMQEPKKWSFFCNKHEHFFTSKRECESN